jgi:hypothetical protein
VRRAARRTNSKHIQRLKALAAKGELVHIAAYYEEEEAGRVPYAFRFELRRYLETQNEFKFAFGVGEGDKVVGKLGGVVHMNDCDGWVTAGVQATFWWDESAGAWRVVISADLAKALNCEVPQLPTIGAAAGGDYSQNLPNIGIVTLSRYMTPETRDVEDLIDSVARGERVKRETVRRFLPRMKLAEQYYRGNVIETM